MVSCKSCKKKDKREYADDCFACDNGDQWEAKRHRSPNKPKTNADRIRAMTDEELAEVLDGSICPQGYNQLGECEASKEICHTCWLDWLKQECE